MQAKYKGAVGIWRHNKFGIAPGVVEVTKLNASRVQRVNEMEHSDRCFRKGQMDDTWRAAQDILTGAGVQTTVDMPTEEGVDPKLKASQPSRALCQKPSDASSDWAAPIRPAAVESSTESDTDGEGDDSKKGSKTNKKKAKKKKRRRRRALQLYRKSRRNLKNATAGRPARLLERQLAERKQEGRQSLPIRAGSGDREAGAARDRDDDAGGPV